MSQNHAKTNSERTEPLPQTSEDSSQDWVCLKCNNLNFSFRKKCNRCKIQTRQDNQKSLYADYYYYYQCLGYQQTQQTPSFSRSEHLVAPEGCHTPQKKCFISEKELSLHSEDQLPSISPLIKRYRAGKHKTRKGKTSIFGWKLFETESWSEQYLPILTLPNVQKDLSLTDDEQASEYFAKSVQQMII